jgi:hypothetical protein
MQNMFHEIVLHSQSDETSFWFSYALTFSLGATFSVDAIL